MDDFWQKWQAYSLTFGPKLAVLRHFLNCCGNDLEKVENG